MNVIELSTSLGYTICRLADSADLYLASCNTHYGAIQTGSLSMSLAGALLMALVSALATA
jgi:hypothetical protein